MGINPLKFSDAPGDVTEGVPSSAPIKFSPSLMLFAQQLCVSPAIKIFLFEIDRTVFKNRFLSAGYPSQASRL